MFARHAPIETTQSKSASVRDFPTRHVTPNRRLADGILPQRKPACACGGGCPRCQTAASNLKISAPDDHYEREADRVAEEIMGTPAPSGEQAPPLTSKLPVLLQRDCYTPAEAQEEEGESPLQRKVQAPIPSSAGVAPQPHSAALPGGGRPLPELVRSFFEPRFGYHFDSVRIHTDERAAELAQAVGARAYTIGRNIVFGAQQYAPETTGGKKLLAHELTHVVQQSGRLDEEAWPDTAAKGPGTEARVGSLHISRMGDESQAAVQRKLCVGGSSAAGLVTMLNSCAGLGGMALSDTSCPTCPGLKNVELFPGPPTGDIFTKTLWDVFTNQSTTACWRGVSGDGGVFMDQFVTRSFDIGDLGNLPLGAPSSAPSAFTRCEDLTHIVTEFWNGDRTGAGFPASHALGLAAQDTFRSEKGQSGTLVRQVLVSTGHGVTEYSNGAKTHVFFTGGNVTSVTHDNPP